jgi:hypothetical protein
MPGSAGVGSLRQESKLKPIEIVMACEAGRISIGAITPGRHVLARVPLVKRFTFAQFCGVVSVR